MPHLWTLAVDIVANIATLSITTMNVNIELTEGDLKKLVISHLTNVLNFPIDEKDVQIEVKSKQNWKAEWEQAVKS